MYKQDRVEDLLRETIDQIESDPAEGWDTLYRLAWREDEQLPAALTDYLWGADIHPEYDMRHIPAGFACSLRLTAFDVSAQTEHILRDAFAASTLESIKLPSGLRTIGPQAFLQCLELQQISFPDSVQHLGRSCFRHSGLHSVVLSENILQISEDCFRNCSSLTDAYIDTSSPLHNTFWGCSNLKRVEFGPSCGVKAMMGVFVGCLELEEILLPQSLVRLGEGTFKDCPSLQSVKLPAGLQHIGSDCFRLCPLLKTLEYAGTKEDWLGVHLAAGWRGSVREVVCADGTVVVK